MREANVDLEIIHDLADGTSLGSDESREDAMIDVDRHAQHVLQLGHLLQDGIPGSFSLVLVASDGDLVRTLVRELDVDVIVGANLGDDGTATANDLGVVLRVDVYSQLVTLESLKTTNGIINLMTCMIRKKF